MKPTDLFNDLQQKVSEALRNSPAKDIEKNVRSMMTQGFARLDLVTRGSASGRGGDDGKRRDAEFHESHGSLLKIWEGPSRPRQPS